MDRYFNLIPRYRAESQRRRALVRNWGVGIAIHAAMAVGACIAARLFLGQDFRPLEAEGQAVSVKIRSTEVQLTAARNRLRELAQKESIAREVLDHPELGALVGVVSRRMGNEVVLRDLRVRVVQEQRTSAAASRAYRVELRGLAVEQAAAGRFVSALEAAGLFTDVRLVRTGREPFATGMASSFEIVCDISEGGRP